MSGFAWIGWIKQVLRRRKEQRFWKRRVRRHGAAAVLHIGHGKQALEGLTERQKAFLLPLLRSQLTGEERVVLDFGCGAGRFTADLARVVSGNAIGVDPVDALIALAPPAADVTYHHIRPPRLPIPSDTVDVVWIACVLCNITDQEALSEALAEIDRVLKPSGLLFLIENTAVKPPTRHLCYRSIAEYVRLFPAIDLHHLQDHEDLGERISVLAGRKRPGAD